MYFNNLTKIGDVGYDHELQGILMNYLHEKGSMNGFDNLDGRPCRYIHRGGDIREGLVSTTTQSSTRQRCLVKGISQFLFGTPEKTLLQCCAMINRAQLKIYTAEANSAIFEFLKAKIHPSLFYFSEYFGPKHAPGAVVDGVAHQDLQQLSFPDDFFDLVLTAEVMEHIPDALQAEREIVRVLKPRGGYVFTLPYLPNHLEDEVRAVVENGKIKHLMDPVYHGDPIRPEGILVFRVFSERGLKQRFDDMGASFHTFHILDKAAGIINMDAFVHVVVKLH